jgi:hypothetical protein
MIELLLEAERDLSYGLLDKAERLYWQVAEADPHNAIAVVGLARVALDRGEERTAYTFARKAAAIDPDNPAAQRMIQRLEEVMAYRGEQPPKTEDGDVTARPAPASSAAATEGKPGQAAAARSPGWFGRVLGRRRDGGSR